MVGVFVVLFHTDPEEPVTFRLGQINETGKVQYGRLIQQGECLIVLNPDLSIYKKDLTGKSISVISMTKEDTLTLFRNHNTQDPVMIEIGKISFSGTIEEMTKKIEEMCPEK